MNPMSFCHNLSSTSTDFYEESINVHSKRTFFDIDERTQHTQSRLQCSVILEEEIRNPEWETGEAKRRLEIERGELEPEAKCCSRRSQKIADDPPVLQRNRADQSGEV